MENSGEKTTVRKVMTDCYAHTNKGTQRSLKMPLLTRHVPQFSYLPIIPTLIVPSQIKIDIHSTCQKQPFKTQSVQKLFSHIYFTVFFLSS